MKTRSKKIIALTTIVILGISCMIYLYLIYRRKEIIFLMIIAMFILCCIISLFLISRSRRFQFFGEIVSTIPNEYKKVALTFDDGPTENTLKILDKLNELNIKATFFLCGNKIAKYMEYTKAICDAGHAIGNHSYSHKRMRLVSYKYCKEEIEKTNNLIREIGYQDTIFFRPPFGKKLFMLPLYLNKVKMATVMWDIEPEIALGFTASAEKIAQHVIANIKSGSIVLLHPMNNTDTVLRASDIIVKELAKQGYSFTTMPDLFRTYKEKTE